jgi:hypothetical protein
MATVIIIFAVVAVLGTVVLMISTSQIRKAVRTEDTTKAYYYARSAVEIVSSDIQKKFGDLKVLYDKIAKSADATEAQKNLDAYNAAVTSFDTLKLVPVSASETCSVQVSGILAQPITVNVTNNNYIPATGKYEVVISCTLTYDGGTSTARARIGTFKEDTTKLKYTTTASYDTANLGDDMAYSWGNIVIQGANITVDHGKKIGAQGKVTNKKGDTLTASYLYNSPVPREMPIMVPPTDSPTNPDYNKYKTQKAKSLTGTQPIGPADEGWYPSIGGPGKHDGVTIDWTVDTSTEDVVLVVDGFYTANSAKINVSGPHKLLIYVREPYDPAVGLKQRELISMDQTTAITTNNGYDNPLTYFIVYDDVVQLYRKGHADTTLLSTDEAYKLSTGVYGSLDTVTIPNLSDIAGYFYLPGCGFYSANNTDAYGAAYASYVDIQGNKDFHYKNPFDFADLFANAGQPITKTVVQELTVDYYATEYGRVWMR